MYQPQNIGPAIKSIFDRGQQSDGKWRDDIDSEERSLQSKLKEICNENYQEFFTSIDDLIDVRSSVKELREQIKRLQTLDSGERLKDNISQWLDLERSKKNIQIAIQQVRSCLHVAQLVHQCLEDGKQRNRKLTAQGADSKGHFTTTMLRSILANSKRAERALMQTQCLSPGCKNVFTQYILGIRSLIKSYIRNDFDTWLRQVDAKATEYGSNALAEVKKQRAINLQQDALCEMVERILDSSPVNQMLLIEGESFSRTYLERHRREDFLCVAQKRWNLKTSDLKLSERYHDCFCKIAGLFIVEQSVCARYQLIRFKDLCGLWEEVSSILESRLKSDINSIRQGKHGYSEILAIKNNGILFKKALSAFDFSAESLLFSFAECFPTYERQILYIFEREIIRVLTEDETYESMYVGSRKDFVEKVVHYKLHHLLPGFQKTRVVSGEALAKLKFPLQLPPSGTILQIAKLLDTLVDRFHAYAIGLPDSVAANFEETFEKAFVIVLVAMKSSRDREGSNISVLSQLRQNSLALRWLCEYIEADHSTGYMKLDKIVHSGRGVKLKRARKKINEFGQMALSLITEQLQYKVMDFFVTTPTRWVATRANRQANAWTKDLQMFLKHILQRQLGSLERNYKDAMYFTVFNKVKNQLIECLVTARQWNVIGLWNLFQDVGSLEDLAIKMSNEERVDGLELVFPGELKDMLDLLLGGKLLQVLDSRETRWNRVPKAKLIAILSHFQPLPSNTRYPEQIKPLEKHTVEHVLKELQRRC